MLAGDVKKCLGSWWKGDPSASRSVEENIQKAHHPFPLWQDQSPVSPLSSKEVIRISTNVGAAVHALRIESSQKH